MLQDEFTVEKYKLLDQFFSIGSNANPAEIKVVEKRINAFVKEYRSDRQIDDVLQLIRFIALTRITNEFESYVKIVEPIVNRLYVQEEWDFYDLRILVFTQGSSDSLEKSEFLLNKAINIIRYRI